MIEFLLAQENLPFAVTMTVVFMAALLEVVLMLIGASSGDLVDGILPDTNGANYPLSWLGFGKAPAFVVLISSATTFSLCGFAIQGLLSAVGLGLMSPGYASAAALVTGFPLTRRIAMALSKIIPADETYVGSRDNLIGQIGTITQGTARRDLPAECRVPDGHGGYLYVQAVPNENIPISEGKQVILVGRNKTNFVVAPFED